MVGSLVVFSLTALAYFPMLAPLLVPFTLLVAMSRVVLGLHYPSDVLAATLELRSFLFTAVYENDTATAEFKKAAGILGGLWEKVRERPDEFLDRRIVDAEGLDAAARDFLAGMTDRFAVELFEQLFIPKPWIGPSSSNRL